MDDETLDAAALAVSFLGEAALRTSAADLLRRSRSVALAAEGANAERIPAASIVLYQRVRKAATALEEAESDRRTQAVSGVGLDSEGRTQAVSGLLAAATALEAVLGVDLDTLRDTAANLARQCCEYREAATAIEKVVAAVEEEQNRPPPPWWLLWRRRGRRVPDIEQALLAAGSTCTALEALGITGVVSTAVDFLHEATARPRHLVELAGETILAAKKLAVPHRSLVATRDALEQADGPTSVTASVNDLEAAATGVKGQGAASAQQITLRNPAMQLVAACQQYIEASNAMAAVQRAATERARQRESAVVSSQNAPPQLPSPSTGQGDERRSDWLGYALYGSLTLAPYLAATNGNPAEDLVLVSDDRWYISLYLSLWWTAVASGAVCSSYARSWMEVCYAQLAARVGMYGINIFAVYFFYWMLGVDDNSVRRCCLWTATALHFLFLVLACCRRDP